jgi:LemA protein
MRALTIVLVVILVIGLLGTCTVVGSHNSLVAMEETVAATWGQIDNMYKRRMDLVPQLVSTVKGVADYEQTTLQQVVDARASVGRLQMPEGMPTDPASLEAYMAAQKGLGGALGRLFAVSESYPSLRATESFLSLQDQLEGTENRIAVARGDFLNAVRAYNTKLRQFPSNIVGGFFGLEKAATLPPEEAAREVPSIDFGGEG